MPLPDDTAVAEFHSKSHKAAFTIPLRMLFHVSPPVAGYGSECPHVDTDPSLRSGLINEFRFSPAARCRKLH